MASTYSTNLAIELIGTGEQSGTWGTTTNTNLGTLIEQSISGYVTQAITDGSGANTTITIPNGATGVARNMFIEMTGALTFSTTSLIVPANKKMYFIFNNTTGGFAVTVKVSGQTGILVPNGKKVVLTSNGTDIVEAHTAIVGNATMGGTLGITGTTTAAAINASGLVAMAGAATVGTTLGVTGTSTMAAINASGAVTGTLNQNANSFLFSANNNNASGSSLAGFTASNGTQTFNAGILGTGYTTNGVLVATNAFVYASTGISIAALGGNVDIAASGTTKVASFSSTGLSVTGTLGVGGAAVGFGNGYNEITIATGANGAMLYLQGTGPLNHRLYGNGAGVTYDASGATSHQFVNNGVNTLGISSAGAVTIPGTLGVTGNTLVGATSQPSSTVRGVQISGDLINFANIISAGTSTSTFNMLLFFNGNGQVGAIKTSGSATTYETSSDYRLKENIQPMTGALATIAALKPVTFNWKTDGSDGQGFIAHELQAVVPDCVSGKKDAVDEEGNAKYQGVDTSFLVATLTAAIQELAADFQAYKSSHP